MAKKKEIQPFGSCPDCWQRHPPELGADIRIGSTPKNIILVKDLAFSNLSRADRFMISKVREWGAEPIILSARQCQIQGIPTLEEIKRNRDTYLLPICEDYPNLPIVALGGLSASYVAGGKCTETSMVNKVYEMHDRICSFTYSFDMFLDKGRDINVLKHIETTIRASLQRVDKPRWEEGIPIGSSTLVIDVETNNANFPYKGDSRCLLVGIMPVGGIPYVSSPQNITQTQKDSLARDTKLVIGHNVMFDLVHLSYLGINFPLAKVHDTMIYQKNLYPNEPFYGLKPLAKKYGDFPHWDAWFASKHRAKEEVDAHEWEKLCDYNAIDLYATEFLYSQQNRDYLPFYLEMDYLKYILRMIQNGFYVDKERLETLLAETAITLSKVETDVRAEFALGVDFNFNSPAQVLALLQKKIPKITGTGVEILSEYREKYPFIDRLLEIRDLSKLKGTGLEGLKEHLDSNNLVHSSYAVHGAETGRSSSSSPNLQNTDPRVRSLFVSRYKDGRLVHTDLSGIEYRLIGHASQDRNLLTIFNTGKDIHDEMYLALFNEYPPNKALRKKAKTANFCGVYGGGYGKFILSADMEDCEESKRLFKVVSGRYPGVTKWKEKIINDLRRGGIVRNLFGRIRRFDVVDMDAEREAVNWVIQSSGHDILDIYLMELCDRVGDTGLLVSEVHDSVTFDCEEHYVESVKQTISELANNLNPLIEETFGVKMRIPIIAEVEVMEHWS